jgi:hypothetical protein
MGVHKRPPQAAGRTGNRPAGGCLRALLTLMPLVTLLAISAIGAPFVTAGDEAGGADEAAVVSDSGVTGTDAAQAPPVEPLPTADAAAEPEPPGSAPPPEPTADAPPPSDQTSIQAEAAEPELPDQAPELAPPDDAAEPSAGDDVASPGPAETAGPAPQDEEPPEVPPAAGPPGESPVHTVAQNLSMVFQVLWQVQEGCQSHCYGTSQLQSALQVASTSQYAEAGGPATAAEAGNSSTTVQFLWQYQVGCVAFCFDTSQSQSALQTADTTQIAVALAGLTALAQNIAETLQFAWQTQVGCAHECHGASQSQSLAQTQTTNQVAAAAPGGSSPVAAGPGELPMWLIALAANVGATIQTIYQLQVAACLTGCTGDAQAQLAAQSATTAQLATAGVGEPPPAPPVDTGLEPTAGTLPDPPAAPAGHAPKAAGAGAAAGASAPAAIRAGGPRRPRGGEWVHDGDARRHARGGERLASRSRGATSALASRTLARDAVTASSIAAASEAVRRGNRVRSAAGAAGRPDPTGTAANRSSGPASASLLEASAEASSRWLLIALLAASLAFVAGAMALRQLQSQVPRRR